MDSRATGVVSVFLRNASDGVVIDITNFIGTITTIDMPERQQGVVIDIDVPSAEAKKTWKSITSSLVNKNTSESDAGTTLTTSKPYADLVTKKKQTPKGDEDGNSIKYSGDYL